MSAENVLAAGLLPQIDIPAAARVGKRVRILPQPSINVNVYMLVIFSHTAGSYINSNLKLCLKFPDEKVLLLYEKIRL